MANFNCIDPKRCLSVSRSCMFWNVKHETKFHEASATNLYTLALVFESQCDNENARKERKISCCASRNVRNHWAYHRVQLSCYLPIYATGWRCDVRQRQAGGRFFLITIYILREPGRNKNTVLLREWIKFMPTVSGIARPSLCAQERRVHNSNLISNCTSAYTIIAQTHSAASSA
jgi:hypothetical protein